MPQVIGVGNPAEVSRKGAKIKLFPGGEGQNNCPRFWYVRDGFGCIFNCKYCYLDRFAHVHEHGAEVDPDVEGLYREVEAWMRRPGPLGLILGEVTDAWGWARSVPWIRERNLRLVEMFRQQRDKTLIFLTKSHLVHQLLQDVSPAPQAVLSWSINAPEVAEQYEMGARQAQRRIEDVARCRSMGWRTRVRMDPMIPISDWQEVYGRLAQVVINALSPEQVTMGTWRPRARDPMYQAAPDELRALLELGPDRRYRLTCRQEMYQHVTAILRHRVPEISLCKEELDVQTAVYQRAGITAQACNCLGAPVPVVENAAPRRHLPVVA